jgi:hypothetical protein
MARVVESVAPEYGDRLNWEKIITRDPGTEQLKACIDRFLENG